MFTGTIHYTIAPATRYDLRTTVSARIMFSYYNRQEFQT